MTKPWDGEDAPLTNENAFHLGPNSLFTIDDDEQAAYCYANHARDLERQLRHARGLLQRLADMTDTYTLREDAIAHLAAAKGADNE
jgi:hypothetical protein